MERGLSIKQAADLLAMDESDLDAWENGAQHPTITQLRQMAAKYEIGFSALLMPEPLPPSTRLKVQDFRTHRGKKAEWHPELLAQMDDINVMIDALADLRDAFPSILPTSPRTITTTMNPVRVAAEERKRIGLTVERQASWKTESDAFRNFRALVEAQGVFVYMINASTTDDWRGFAVYDDRRIPVIVINSNEAENPAKTFSLFHEYAHILLRQSAISNERSRDAMEIFCNKFAAHFLMPEDQFRGVVLGIGGVGPREWSDLQIKKIGNKFKTSMSAVVLHLENLGLAPRGFYKKKLEEWRARKKPTPHKRQFGPNYYEQVANRLGSKHVSVVFDALDRGYVDQLDAYEMLDVQESNFPGLRDEIMERKTAHGWRP
jgi:Zn-dependent peptidase ImmA (M78 family)/transcriptional regulator with XRE-family HTH domain